MNYKPKEKDYVVAGNFYGAVVSNQVEDERVLSTIRYYQDNSGKIKKITTLQANDLLNSIKPDYIFYSTFSDVKIHGIPLGDIDSVYHPVDCYVRLLSTKDINQKQKDTIEAFKFLLSSGISDSSIGITGSLLLGFENEQSDIDIVIYGRDNFHLIRYFLAESEHSKRIEKLDRRMWQDAYQRRDCEINFDEYLFHEQRKYNKFKINNSKVDVSLVLLEQEHIDNTGPYLKVEKIVMETVIVDDSQGFDLPARYYTDNADIPEIISYTVTYAGQAVAGEKVEVSGYVEIDQNGDKRLIVGSSREARGEYIKVIKK